ncbi:MAG: hypothetical protein JOZ52_04480 [Acidobacteria bacterium]|nr:hypothetical protein [Acidobacteriota bacterium]
MTGKIQPDTLNTDALHQVAQALTPWLDTKTVERLFFTKAASPVLRMREDAPHSPLRLQETFAIYRLGAKSIKDAAEAGKDIAEFARNTGRWHHQVKVDEEPVAFARTCAAKQDGAYDVCQFFVSDLSKAIDDAITWIDKYEAAHPEYAETDPLVRLLVVPAYNVLAFWLLKQKTGQSDLLVIDALAELVELKEERLLSSAEFLKAFGGHDPITGVAFDGEDPLDDGEENDAEDEKHAYQDFSSSGTDARIESTTLRGDNEMSDQDNVAPASSSANNEVENVSDKTIFHFPDVGEQNPLFMGFVYSATRAEGVIEDESGTGESGLGQPLYLSFVFPYVPPEDGEAGNAANAPARKMEQPLFVSYIFPYLEADEIDLSGGKGGSVSDVGGGAGKNPLFYSRIMSFIAKGKAEDEDNNV